jgi:alpha-N-arabinofuranosidase
MGIKEGMTYHFSLLAGQISGDVTMRLELVTKDNKVLGSAILIPGEGYWNKYGVSFTANGTDPKAYLNIWFEGSGSLDIDMISLFPDDTWKNRPGGLRADLVQLLADMKPGFLRFPGGCIVEGRELTSRYQWKKTVGDVETRELIVNRWNTEFSHRSAPDYFQSFGLGFYEYFLLSEDLGAEPLPILSCGMACQFNTAEVVPMDQLDPYIRDALDLIEFANGPVSSEWGKIRAKMGHPAPFNLKYIGIGNEQWGPQYIERYKVFATAIKEKYPNMILVSGTGPSPDGADFEFASAELKKLNAEIVDEHYYRSPEWFFKNAARYDTYDRNSYKIFAGEYASHIPSNENPQFKNTWLSALSEAAFMTGLERNADVVHLCSYAPLFAHTEAWQWSPDLIWFDNLSSFGTPNYYVQKLYSLNSGTHVVPLTWSDKPLTGQDGMYASAVIDQRTREIIVKIVNSNAESRPFDLKLETSAKLSGTGKITVLSGSDIHAYNSIEKPNNVVTRETNITIKGKLVSLNTEPLSLTVVKISLK